MHVRTIDTLERTHINGSIYTLDSSDPMKSFQSREIPKGGQGFPYIYS